MIEASFPRRNGRPFRPSDSILVVVSQAEGPGLSERLARWAVRQSHHPSLRKSTMPLASRAIVPSFCMIVSIENQPLLIVTEGDIDRKVATNSYGPKGQQFT